MKKAALHNLGCKVNAYETEAMQQMLEDAGYEIVPFSEVADVYVINTCSVTNMADRKSRQMLHHAKKMNPQAAVVAAGCYVQTKEEEAKLDDAIDILIGNNQKAELVGRLDEYFAKTERVTSKQEEKVEAVVDINHIHQDFEELGLKQTAEHTRAFVKVQDGCNQFCSYCIIPYARGRVRSRGIESVLKEIRGLAEKGYQEVVLTGIHLSSYGVDCDNNLLHLIQEVHKIDGIRRIRLGSLEPKIVTEEFAGELAKLEKICPHFHLSLQSGCDDTLKRMNRKYTAKEYEEGCRLLRKYFIHPAITTDVIVGFPGETEEDYISSREFVKKVKFAELHVFKYSKRDGTVAAKMPNQIDEKIKTLRSEDLIKTGEELTKEFRQAKIGQDTTVLFEEKILLDNKEYWVGHTVDYIKIAVSEKENLEGQIRKVNVKDFLTNEIMLATM